ncbi:hypothetical protein THAOC_07624, partial [Thalassiosira oceanica]
RVLPPASGPVSERHAPRAGGDGAAVPPDRPPRPGQHHDRPAARRDRPGGDTRVRGAGLDRAGPEGDRRYTLPREGGRARGERGGGGQGGRPPAGPRAGPRTAVADEERQHDEQRQVDVGGVGRGEEESSRRRGGLEVGADAVGRGAISGKRAQVERQGQAEPRRGREVRRNEDPRGEGRRDEGGHTPRVPRQVGRTPRSDFGAPPGPEREGEGEADGR